MEGTDRRGRTEGIYRRLETQRAKFYGLCRIFGVSRPAGYKWLERYQSEGETALADLSRAPLFQPRAMPETLRSRILELRAQHPTGGPKKLKARRGRVYPEPAPIPKTRLE